MAIHKTEADIVINDIQLTFDQSMTVRVALSAFAFDLKENGLGNDENGISIKNNYLNRIKEINDIIFSKM